MRFTSKLILESFKDTKIADAPALKHTQYLSYLAQRLGYLHYAHFKRCVELAPSDRIGDFYTGLMKNICAIRLPKENVDHVRLGPFDGKSIGYDSYFIGWDRRGREVRVPRSGYDNMTIIGFREIFEEPLYVIETEAELFAWQWRWGGFAAVPTPMARDYFPFIFDRRNQVVENPPIDKIERRIQRELRKKGLI